MFHGSDIIPYKVSNDLTSISGTNETTNKEQYKIVSSMATSKGGNDKTALGALRHWMGTNSRQKIARRMRETPKICQKRIW